MFKKNAAALLLSSILVFLPLGWASADPDTANIVIKKGEQSDNVILLQMRLRDLGYYDYKITGFFGDFTADALKDFQRINSIEADGVAGEKTLDALYGNNAKRQPLEPLDKPITTSKKANTKPGAYADWSTVNQLWKIGMRCKVIDYDSGISYIMIRCNQSYTVGHADVAPATKSDYKAFKKTFNGTLNAYRRALVVIIGGKRYAASIYGEPHGSTGVPGNGMIDPLDGSLGQVCIHFKNSRNNIHDMIDAAHQYQIKRAAGLKPSGPAPYLVYPGD